MSMTMSAVVDGGNAAVPTYFNNVAPARQWRPGCVRVITDQHLPM